MADIVQNIVVYRLPDVPDRPLHVSGRDDLMSPWCVFVSGEDADFPPGHLLFVDVHRLQGDRKVIRTWCHRWTTGRVNERRTSGEWRAALGANVIEWWGAADGCNALTKATIVRRHSGQSSRVLICPTSQIKLTVSATWRVFISAINTRRGSRHSLLPCQHWIRKTQGTNCNALFMLHRFSLKLNWRFINYPESLPEELERKHPERQLNLK